MVSHQLIRTDLNLLIAMQILLEERNVTHAAARLFVSQPALSKTLKKLRDTFDDELFTRSPHGLIPTARALEIEKQLPAALSVISEVLSNEQFDISTYEGNLCIALPQVLAEETLPQLMPLISEKAPKLRLQTEEALGNFSERLALGKLDFAIHIDQDYGGDFISEPLGALNVVCLMKKNHPLAKKNISLQQFLNYPHIRVMLTGLNPRNTGIADMLLAKLNLKRHIALETSNIPTALGVLESTDYLMVASLAESYMKTKHPNLINKPLPSELLEQVGAESVPKFNLALIYHRRSNNNPAFRWLHDMLTQIISSKD